MARHDHAKEHKTLQLCRQVQHAVSASLASDFDDPVLLGLYVEEVTPAPDASRVLILVRVDEEHDPAVAKERLESIHSWLRQEVAHSINRKRTPELSFLVLHAHAVLTPP